MMHQSLNTFNTPFSRSRPAANAADAPPDAHHTPSGSSGDKGSVFTKQGAPTGSHDLAGHVADKYTTPETTTLSTTPSKDELLGEFCSAVLMHSGSVAEKQAVMDQAKCIGTLAVATVRKGQDAETLASNANIDEHTAVGILKHFEGRDPNDYRKDPEYIKLKEERVARLQRREEVVRRLGRWRRLDARAG